MGQHVQAAVYCELAKRYGLPSALQMQLESFVRLGNVQQIVFCVQDQSISMSQERTLRVKLASLLKDIKAVREGMEGPMDYVTLLGNFETITGKPFVQPAWLSSEIRKVE
jgi:hypothetical protein